LTISDKEHLVLLKDNVDKMATLGNDDSQYLRNQFLDYLKLLTGVVNELHEEKEN
jgi:hypothetical protein